MAPVRRASPRDRGEDHSQISTPARRNTSGEKMPRSPIRRPPRPASRSAGRQFETGYPMNTHSTRRDRTAASRRAATSPERIRGTLSLDSLRAAIDALPSEARRLASAGHSEPSLTDFFAATVGPPSGAVPRHLPAHPCREPGRTGCARPSLGRPDVSILTMRARPRRLRASSCHIMCLRNFRSRM